MFKFFLRIVIQAN